MLLDENGFFLGPDCDKGRWQEDAFREFCGLLRKTQWSWCKPMFVGCRGGHVVNSLFAFDVPWCRRPAPPHRRFPHVATFRQVFTQDSLDQHTRLLAQLAK
jgi:hypothetical protein